MFASSVSYVNNNNYIILLCRSHKINVTETRQVLPDNLVPDIPLNFANPLEVCNTLFSEKA